MHGAFIVLEGGEGTGKTTQRELLKERLPALFPNREFVFTREPGGTPLADTIRSVILSEAAKHSNGLTNFGLFLASRADHVEVLIRPTLAAGKVVFCDRYLASTYAYQIVAQELPELAEIFFAHTKLVPQPDLTIWLDMPPVEALARIESRAEKNHLDARSVSFHERIRAGFAEFFAQAKEAVVRIDASPSSEEVFKEVQKAVASIL